MDEPTPPALDGGSKLCEACSVIRSSDYELVREHYLQDAGGLRQTEIPLDYQLTDRVPDLPALREGADSGCEFCHALRGEVLRVCKDLSCDVDISLSYCLGDMDAFRGIGLAGLIARLGWNQEPPGMPQQNLFRVPRLVVFCVESDDGMSPRRYMGADAHDPGRRCLTS